MRQDLKNYNLPSDWSPGASFLVQCFWFCLGSPLLSLRCLPGSYWRIWLLRLFGTKISLDCRIKPGFRVKYPWKLIVGRSCWLGEDVWIDNISPVQISNRVCISQGAYLCTGNHNFRSQTFDLLTAPIFLGTDVWIGAHSVIAPGIIVHDYSVVCLSSVVLSDIPPSSIVRGNPASVVGIR
jgi:putative colanic acid biosynthesis acetyltransferase WcaF